MAESRKLENLATKTKVWQQPFVNVFKWLGIDKGIEESDTHRYALIHGDVRQPIDKEAGRRVFRITGSVPAANYLQIPRTVNQALGLTGRYLYLGVKPADKVHVLHVDLATQQGHTMRLSFSNMYKSVKFGSRMIRFPSQLAPDKWTLFCVDCATILTHGQETHSYSHLKGVQLCANMSIRSLYTTDTRFTSDTLPRDFWPVPQRGKGAPAFDTFWVPDQVEFEQEVEVSLNTVPTITKKKSKRKNKSRVEVVKHGWESELETLVLSPHKKQQMSPIPHKSGQPTEPDAIVTLQRVIGFTGGPGSGALWLDDGHVVFPAGTSVVVMSVKTGWQRVLFGHTAAITAMSLSSNGRYLATAHGGKDSLVRLWDFGDGVGSLPADDDVDQLDPAVSATDVTECVAVLAGSISDLSALAWSQDSNSDPLIAAVGRDHRGRFALAVWNAAPIARGGRPKLISMRSHDYDTRAVAFSASTERIIVTCGHGNIRIWRIKDGDLRTASLDLGDHHDHDFTTLAFQPFPGTHMLAATADGKVFQIDYKGRTLRYIYQLHDTAILSIGMCNDFCVTGADDGLLRLWRPDFSHSFMEIQHDGPVCACHVQDEGEDHRVLVSSVPGAVGYLSVGGHTYQNIVRSHGGPVLDLAIHPTLAEFSTVSEDGTARVWSRETYTQLYEFEAPGECTHAVCYHPSERLLACGFGSGQVRVFDIETTKCLHETQPLYIGPVLALVYDRDGARLFSAGADGRVVCMDVNDNYSSQLIRTTLAPQLPPDLVPAEVDDARTATSSPRKITSTLAAAIDAAKADMSGDEVCKKCMAGDANVSMAFNEDGSLMCVCGGGSGNISILSSSSLEMIVSISTEFESIASAVFTGDDVLATADGTVILHCDPFTSHVRHGQGAAEIPKMSMALAVSPGGAHAVTGGSDGLLRVHSAESKHSPTAEGHGQVFLGHGTEVTCVRFLPDGMGVISTDKAGTILVWDFLGVQMGGGSPDLSILSDDGVVAEAEQQIAAEEEEQFVLAEEVRGEVPTPWIEVEEPSQEDVVEKPKIVSISGLVDNESRDVSVRVERGSPISTVDTADVDAASPANESWLPELPTIHYVPRAAAPMADTRYAPSPSDAGLKLQYLLGYSGRSGHDNVVWHPDTGLFVYSAAGSLVVEDLQTRCQRHLLGHTSDVSCLAVSCDGALIASASGSADTAQVAERRDGIDPPTIGRLTIINIWDAASGQCLHSLAGHSGGGVQTMAFSPDGKFLASVGTAADRTLAVWRIGSSTQSLVATAELPTPVHRVAWDPHSHRELVTVGRGDGGSDGRGNAVLFWLVEDSGNQLKFQEADHCRPANPTPEVAAENEAAQGRSTPIDHTAVVFSKSPNDRVMYVGDVNGAIGVWDTVENRFLIQWIAHRRPPQGNRGFLAAEIDVIQLSSDGTKMITAGASGEVKIWSISIQSHTGTLVNSVDLSQVSSPSLFAENERIPGVAAACFDDNCEDGVVGSYAGQIYFVSMDPRSSGGLVRLAGAHAAGRPVLCLGCDTEGRLLGTGGSDGCLRLWTMPSALGDPSGMEVEGWYSEAGVYAGTGSSCMSIAFHPVTHACLAGFGDGSMLAIDLAQSRVAASLQLAEDRYSASGTPWAAEKASITHCMFISETTAIAGTRDGLLFVIGAMDKDWSSPQVLRIDDTHRGHAIDSLDVCRTDPNLVLACDGAANISIWLCRVDKGDDVKFDLTNVYSDHLEFGTSPLKESTASVSALPCLVSFHPRESSVLLVAGFGPDPSHLLYYNYQTRSVLRAVPLMHSLLCMSMSPSGYYLAMGTTDRLVKLVDVDEGTFQDFIGHSDAVDAVCFAPSSRHLYTAGRDGAILCWNARA